jgi:hypothetical protein
LTGKVVGSETKGEPALALIGGNHE